MQMQELTIKRREGTGKQLAKRLRRAGVVPAVLYGGATHEIGHRRSQGRAPDDPRATRAPPSCSP